MHHSLVRIGPDNLLTYLYHVLRVDLLLLSGYRNHFIAAKNTHISDILSSMHAFLGTLPCTDVIASF